jgi:hypothetical protein
MRSLRHRPIGTKIGWAAAALVEKTCHIRFFEFIIKTVTKEEQDRSQEAAGWER